MSQTNRYRNVYLIGIGGIGMSSIARYFHSQDFTVSGYDRTSSPLTKKLEDEGISIHYEEDVTLIPFSISETLVIYTPAIPKDSIELNHIVERGYSLMKRSEVLGEIANSRHLIAVAGTHGKTSISTMTAHIYHDSGVGCSAFLGGISQNYDSNLILADKSNSNVVVEADEFDRSFLRLTPNIALISSTDADHLDIYGDHNSVRESFALFAERVKERGVLICHKNCEIRDLESRGIKRYSYSLDSDTTDFYAKNIRVEEGIYIYDIVTPQGVIENIHFKYPGLINVENSVASASLASIDGVSHDKIKSSLEIYKGVRRRFDIRYSDNKVIYIDDYAHHPTELEATISSVKSLYRDAEITVIFQPHLYSRTKDFYSNFGSVLSKVDRVMLLDIYPARELPIEGVTSNLILDKIDGSRASIVSKEEVLKSIEGGVEGVILTLGAGDIDRLVDPIVELLGRVNI